MAKNTYLVVAHCPDNMVAVYPNCNEPTFLTDNASARKAAQTLLDENPGSDVKIIEIIPPDEPGYDNIKMEEYLKLSWKNFFEQRAE